MPNGNRLVVMCSVDRRVWHFLRRGQRALWTLRRPRPLPAANAKAQLEIFIALNELQGLDCLVRGVHAWESRFHFFGGQLEDNAGKCEILWQGKASVACRM